jgi:hypothetical protein
VGKKLRENQYGLIDNRSTVDLILALRQILEKCWEFGKET